MARRFLNIGAAARPRSDPRPGFAGSKESGPALSTSTASWARGEKPDDRTARHCADLPVPKRAPTTETLTSLNSDQSLRSPSRSSSSSSSNRDLQLPDGAAGELAMQPALSVTNPSSANGGARGFARSDQRSHTHGRISRIAAANFNSAPSTSRGAPPSARVRWAGPRGSLTARATSSGLAGGRSRGGKESMVAPSEEGQQGRRTTADIDREFAAILSDPTTLCPDQRRSTKEQAKKTSGRPGTSRNPLEEAASEDRPMSSYIEKVLRDDVPDATGNADDGASFAEMVRTLEKGDRELNRRRSQVLSEGRFTEFDNGAVVEPSTRRNSIEDGLDEGIQQVYKKVDLIRRRSKTLADLS